MSITTTTASTSTSGGTEDAARAARDRDFSRALGIAIVVVAALGLGAELVHYTVGASPAFVDTFSLSMERNVPTWFATCLLFACGALLFRIARATAEAHLAFVRHWRALGAIFLFMSLDEAIEIHEYLAYVVEGRGWLYFSWVVPAAVIVLVVGAAFARFLGHLEPVTRRRFVVAGIVYVSGALLCELPLGAWTERHGDDNLGYAFIDFVEETLELVGAGYFLVSLRAYVRKVER